MKFDLKRVNWYSVVAGVIVLLLWSPFWQMQADFYTHSTVTVGVVTKLNHGGHHPEVEFTASNGERISFHGHAYFSVDEGDRLDVRYRTDNPSQGPKVNGILGPIDIGPAVIAIVFIIAGLLGKSVSYFSNKS